MLDAQVEDRAAHLLGRLTGTLDRVVEEHQRVQVAVAGVEDVGHADAGVPGEVGDRLEHLGQRGARDDAVLDDVVGADPPDRGERGLAALPDQRAVGRVGGEPLLEGAVLVAQPLDLGVLLLDLDRSTVELDDEHGAGAVGVVAVHGGLGGLDRERVHHLDRGGHDAGGDDRRGRRARLVGAVEADQDRADLLGQPDQPDGGRGDDAERALGADDRAEQVVAGAVRRDAAERDGLALRR